MTRQQTRLSWYKIALAIILITPVVVLPSHAGEREDYTFAYNLFQRGDRSGYVLAKDQFKAFIRDYPDSENADDARFLMGECALRLDAYDEAVGHYKQLMSDHPASPLRLDALRGVAAAWFNQGKYEEAITAYEEVLKQSQDKTIISQSFFHIGESYDRLGVYQKAVEFFDKTINNDAESDEAKDALYAKGWSLYRLESYQAAYDVLTQFIEAAPSHYAVPEASYRAAESLFKLGNWSEAKAAYQEVIDTYAQDEAQQQLLINAQFRVGECLFQLQQMGDARNTFKRFIQTYGTSPVAAEAQYWIAEILLEEKKYPESIHEYQNVITLYPQSDVVDDAQFGIAMAHFQQKDYARARSQFKIVADNLRSDLVDAANFRIGECFRLQREFNSAILYYRKVKSRSSYVDDALYAIATSSFELRDYSEASRTLNTLLQSYPTSPLKSYALYQLGLTHFHEEEYQKCVSTIDKFLAETEGRNLETAPADEALFWKVRALYQLEDYQNVIQTAQQLLKAFEGSSFQFQAEFFIAESIYWSEQTPLGFQSARKKYQALLDKRQTGVWAEKCRFGIGWTHFSEAALSQGQNQSQHYEAAIRRWEEVIQYHSRGPFADDAQYQIGIARFNLKQYRGAIDAFNLVISRYPGSDWQADAQYQIGRALYKQENYPAAITAFDRVIQDYRGSALNPKSVFGIANAYFKQRQFREAITYYQQVVDRFPNQTLPIRKAGAEPIIDLRPEAQYFIGESHSSLQNYNEAITAYEKVVKNYPKSDWADDAQYGIALAYENLGQKERAVQAYRQLMNNYAAGELAPDVQLQIARFHYEDQDYTRAIAEFQKVINQYGSTPAAQIAQFNIGKSYVALGSYRQAVAAFERVNPDSDLGPAAAYEVGYAWYDQRNQGRNVRNAISALLKVQEKYPNQPDTPRALLLAGQCYEELVEHVEAVEVYRRILSDYPDAEEAKLAQLFLGHAFRSQKEYKQAIEAYDTIRRAKAGEYPVDIVIESILYMGQTQSLMGQYRDSGTTYLRVPLVYKQNNPLRALHATLRAAEAFANVGDLDHLFLAKETYEDAIELYDTYAGNIDDSVAKSEWDSLQKLAKTKLQQILNKIGQ